MSRVVLLRGGRVNDPATGIDDVADVRIEDELLAAT
jgi:predicted amidohydrolase